MARAFDPDGLGEGWTLEAQLLATVAEISDETNRILATVYGKKNAPMPQPMHIDRPGRRKKKNKPLTGAELANSLKGRGGQIIVDQKE